MNSRFGITTLLLTLTSSAALLTCACTSTADDCELTGTCGGAPPVGGSGGTGGTGGSGGDGGGGTPPECVPSEATEAVSDECGIFVSSSLGDDGNSGTKEAPFATIGAALAAAGGDPVYVCAESFDEAVSVTTATDLFGGLDCTSGWAYVGATTKTALTAPADSIVVRVEQSAGGTTVADFAITARNATADGASSIVVLVDQAEAVFEGCELAAGAGANGATGTTPSGTAQAGDPGNQGASACSDNAPINGGAQVSNNCPNGVSVGGAGGTGDVATGGPGANGQTGAAGSGGDGQTAYSGASWSCAADGTGQGGEPGSAGDAGAPGTGLGTLGSAGLMGADGGNGQAGTPGEGGGGGGGARNQSAACSYFCGNNTQGGASGGSGGAGGCGGEGGGGGQAGGASIALVSVGATVTL
ncbi:MAG: hypothetical protein JRI55_18445, partial [Deltaproteobacteria bacterium]|nr:hypothetical protein [Deltaproteobacteria bacterium]